MRSLLIFIMLVLFIPSTSIAAPKADIIADTFPSKATKTTIHVKNAPFAKEIQYRIWRTADGRSNMKTFLSADKQHNFTFVLDTKDFQSLRGQYEIEAVPVIKGKPANTIAKTTITFQQYVPILMYHSIAEFTGSGMKELYVTPANFEEQIRYLRENGFTPLTFERWNEVNTVNKPVFITLDDGYKNNINAWATFRKLKSEHFQPTATIFVISGFVGRKNRLTTDDLRSMAQSGFFSIQSHTVDHPDLREVTNLDEELGKSKDMIEAMTGKPVIAFAYPYGFYNDKIIQKAKQYYQFAVTVRKGLFIESGTPNEFYTMPRQFVEYTTTIDEFARLLTPPH